MDDVLIVLSSEDEDNGENKRRENHRPKNTTSKKGTVQLQLTDKFPLTMQKATVVRTPPNNIPNPKQTVITGYKQNKQKQISVVQLNSKKSLGGHITSKASAGITIAPVASVNSRGQLIAAQKGVSLIKPQIVTNASKSNVVILSKTNNAKAVPVPTSTPTPTSKPNTTSPSRLAKRIHPTKIADAKVRNRTSSIEKSSDSDMLSRDSSVAANDEAAQPPPQSQANGTNQSKENDEPSTKRPRVDSNEKTIIHDDYKELMNTCKAAESSNEMKKVIDKLKKYYHRAHPDYVRSKSFHKLVKNVTNDIKREPSLVYIKISSLLEELKTRRTIEGASAVVENAEEAEVDEKKTKRVQKLSEALQKLQKRIRRCEEAEVDWEDELNSNYLLTERYKKRAFDIYAKICDLTGESCHAERIIKKPIKFRGTSYPEFNRKLEKFVNDTKSFPDMFDVLRIMDHCNKDYNYRLSSDSRRTIAQDAFTQIGNELQKRRKSDLYEMVQYYTSNHKDPAREDADLKTKLDENHRHYTNRMNEVIERFTKRQDRDSSDENAQSPNRSDSNNAIRSKKPKLGATSVNSTAQTTKSTATSESTTTSQPPAPPPQMPLIKMDADLEINDADDLIIPDDDGLQLIDDEDMEVIANEIPLFPTITSVTSLHDRPYTEFFDSNPLERSNIL